MPAGAESLIPTKRTARLYSPSCVREMVVPLDAFTVTTGASASALPVLRHSMNPVATRPRRTFDGVSMEKTRFGFGGAV